MPGLNVDVYIEGNYAYIARWDAGLKIIDINDPENPVNAGYYDTSGEARGVYVDSNYVYIADGYDGLYIIQNDLLLSTSEEERVIPSMFYLSQNFPNPFNPATTLKYDLPEASHVTLTIYDITGRTVKILVNSHQEAGYKSIRWDGTNDRGEPVSAGMYLYRIRAGQYVETKKMVMLK